MTLDQRYRVVRICLLAIFICILTVPASVFAQLPIPTDVPAPVRTWTSPGHTRYYVDSVNGSDTNDGKSPAHAWKTLGPVDSGTYSSGDWILLKSGCHWDGYLAPGGSGSRHHPVKISSFGKGPKPSIDSHGLTLATVSIHNGEYWDVENLDVANTSTTPIPFLHGVEVSLYNYGTAHDITLRNLDIHDVASALDKNHGGSGIFCDNRGDNVRSRYDGLLIENCHLKHVDRNGISMDSGYWDRTKWFPSYHVEIRNNLLEDIGGDCILAIGCDGVRIEHNTVHGGRERAKDWASGIWVWSCDNSIIQYNESSGMHGLMDAQGFDADWNTRNTIIQYNYSHNNDGGFAMICNPGSEKPPSNIGNIGTIVRYNISQNDGFRTFTFSGPISNAQIYNNTIYVGKKDGPILLFSWNWGHRWPDNTQICNNIFDVDGRVTFQEGGMTNTVIEGNDWWGNIPTPPFGSNGIFISPQLLDPGNGRTSLHSLSGYSLKIFSPCRNAGISIANNGGRDFWGNPVPNDGPPSIGASQN
jgi:hypothetical protein